MTTFRAWRYGPKGEAQIFENEADVPRGWKDSPPKQNETDAARRELDVPPGRLDIAAIPTQLSVISSQILAEVMARSPVPDERPSYVPPSAAADRIGEREAPKVIEDPVRDQGDKQPHIEAHNWGVADQARMLAREAKAAEDAIAARENTGEAPPAVQKIEAAFEPEEADKPTLDQVRADPDILTDDQTKALAEAKAEGIDPIGEDAPGVPHPLDRDGDGKKGGSKPKARK